MRIAKVLGIPLADFALLIDAAQATLEYAPDSEDLQGRLTPYGNTLGMVSDYLDEDLPRVRMWLNLP